MRPHPVCPPNIHSPEAHPPPTPFDFRTACSVCIRVLRAVEPQMARSWDLALDCREKGGAEWRVGDPLVSRGREFFPFRYKFQVMPNGVGILPLGATYLIWRA